MGADYGRNLRPGLPPETSGCYGRRMAPLASMAWRRRVFLLLVLVLCFGPADPASSEEWSSSLSGFLFLPPDDDAIVSPILAADRGSLHLEARYNYEDLRTGSAFVGRNFHAGDELAMTATPMLGFVVGQTNGVVPGLELYAAWRALAWYSEWEYVIELDDGQEDYFYTWLEATIAPASWLRCGLVAQRTRVIDSDLDVNRGPLVEGSLGPLSVGAYWFNPDRPDEDYFAFSLGFEF